MNLYDYKTVSYARPQKALPTNDPIDLYDYKTVSYARPQAGGTTSSSSGSIWRDLGSIAGKMSGQMSGSLSDDPERRKYESALMEAEAILGPQYQRAREQTMSEVDRNMVSRGFYGQAPGDAIRASTLTDLDMAYQAALGNYATNIMDRRAQMDLQKEQMDLQKYMFDKGLEEQWKMFDTNVMDRRAQMDLQKYMFDKRLEEQWKMFEKEMGEQRQQSKDRKKSSIWTGLGIALGGFLGGPGGAAIGTGIGNILSSLFE